MSLQTVARSRPKRRCITDVSVIVETATGKIVRQDSISPRTQPWLDDFARLRTEMAIAERFGDLSAAKDGLTRVLSLLDDLSKPDPPPEA